MKSSRRHWRFGKNELVVEDIITAQQPSVARYHLAPGLHLQESAPGAWLVRAGSDTVAHVNVEAGQAAAAESLHATRFGVLQPAQTLEVALHESRAVTRWRW